DEDERRALKLLALGEPLDTSIYESIAGPGALASLERKGLIAEGHDRGRLEIRVAHPLYAEAVRASRTSREARVISAVLFERFAAGGPVANEDTGRVGLWHLDAGGDDVDILRAGFEMSANSTDFVLAQRFAEAAFRQRPGMATAWPVVTALHYQGR